MFRVLTCITTEHDYRLVLVAALICATTSLTSFHAYSHATQDQGPRRLAWVLLTGVCTGAGIWATHFVAMLAYAPGYPTAYNPALTIGSLLIAVAVAVAGLAVSTRGGRPMVAAGGAIIGAGIAMMHFTGMRALEVPGTISWNAGIVAASILIGIGLTSASLLAWHELDERQALWVAPGLLTLAICGLHFTAMGAVTIVPDPSIVVHASALNSSTLAIAVTGITMLVMLALLVMSLITNQAERQARVRNQELVDAAQEGLVVAQSGSIVNVNRRILTLTRRSPEELLGKSVMGDLVIGDIADALAAHEPAEASLKTATGIAIPVEVVRQPLSGSARANEVYAIRDLSELRRAEQELRRQNKALQQREEELHVQNRRFAVALANMPHGLCMVDRERRVVVCNRRFADMYGLTPELTRPGTSVEQILAHCIGKGLYADAEAEEYRRERLGPMHAASVNLRQLSDGRIIQIDRQPTDEGGWITVHEDITEREDLNARLGEQNALLKQHEAELQTQNANLDAALAKLETQNVNLDMALANMAHGLAMFDAEERLVLANGRYAEIYGLEPQYLQPGVSLRELVERRIAKDLYPGGLTVDDVVDNMRQRVALKGASHLISRLGDGRILSVSVHPRREGGWVVTLQDITEREELNARLKTQNALLQQREAELAAQNTRFDAAIGNMSQGMCLYDAEQRIVFANDRYAEIYGLTRAQVKPGTTLHEIFAARAAKAGYGEAEAENFVREGMARFGRNASQIMKLEDGRFISVVRRPMPGGGLLSTHEDISERERLTARLARQNELMKEREQELNARNEQLDAALENMQQGLAMYDAEQRLIMCNKRYASMYGLTPEQVKQGTTLKQMFEYRLANGHYHIKDTETFVQGWTGEFGELSTRIQELADGRIISVSRRRLASGGRVVTHEDITERQRLNARLEQQHNLLKQQGEELRASNVQLDAALNNMLQGLAMYDGEQRLVMCNNRYAEMYGLTADQVQPGTPLQRIIEHRIAKGEFPGKSADQLVRGMIDRVAGQKAAHYTSQLGDGRQIAVSVQSMPGGGTVTTHHDITEQRRSEAKIAHMALHDALTGLPNRVLLNERLEDALRRVKRGEIVATHLLDLDHFKTVNDTLGHPAGDRLLQMVADRLRTVARETDTIARMGGDEFTIVQSAIAQPADATALAHRMIEAVGAPYPIEGQQVVIGTSVGIAVGPSDGTSPEQLLRNADLALYRAKGDGRGTYRFFEADMDAQMQARRAMECDLRKALPAGEFELHYQPVVNLASNSITGFEALIRWHHPEKGLVPPNTFIPLAEEIGFIVPLGEWAVREACSTAAQWPGDLKVAVNLSPVQFRSPGLVHVVVGALASSGLAAEQLELEITESTLLQDCEATLATLYQLRALGVRIAMDDFGTGYSSLSYLQSFPFDRIKIDRSFVKDIADGVGSLNIVRAVAAMANGLGMATTAEGVETKEQLDTVRAEGCTEMQGFVFSRPMPASEIAQFLLARGGDAGGKAERAQPPKSAAGAA